MYTFENFVVQDHNRMAFNLATLIAENCDGKYSPLFLYSKPGLGKTHLLKSIEAKVKAEKDISVLYCTAEKFCNEYIEVLHDKNTISNFNEIYGTPQIFLIDNFEFLLDKPGFQQRFFTEFNYLHLQNKNIVIASGEPINAFDSMEERYRSRLRMGMILEIIPPSKAEIYHYCRARMEEYEIILNEEDMKYVCENLSPRNYYVCKGFLNKLKAIKEYQENITMDYEIRSIIPERITKIQPEDVLHTVSQYYELDEKDLTSRKKNQYIAVPRQVAYLLMHQLIPDMTFCEIAEIMGRDSTTVSVGARKIEDEISQSRRLQGDLLKIRQLLNC